MAGGTTGKEERGFDLSMLGDAELAAMESLLEATGDESAPEIVEQLKAALTQARTHPIAQDPADALLGRALMSGGVSCSDGIALFERGMSSDAKRYCVLAALPAKSASAAALDRLASDIQNAVAPGRAVATGDAVGIVLATSTDSASSALVKRVRTASVIAGVPCAVGVAEPTPYFELLSVCYDHARFAAGRARSQELDELSFDECRFDYLAEKMGLDDQFTYVRDTRVLGLYESDFERGSDLLATAVTYIQCGFNLAQTAAAMHLHRNSVVYRLNRIAERSGIDLLGPYDDYDLLTLLLTCKLYRTRLDEDAVPAEWTPAC